MPVSDRITDRYIDRSEILLSSKIILALCQNSNRASLVPVSGRYFKMNESLSAKIAGELRIDHISVLEVNFYDP